jgi:type VI secretion system protein VasG
MRESRNVTFRYDEGLVEAIAARCTEVESGARNVDHVLSNALLPEMSQELLSRMASGQQLKEMHVSVGEAGFTYTVS